MHKRFKQPIPSAIYAIAIATSVGFALVGAFDTAKTGLYLGTAALTILLSGFIFFVQPNFDKRSTRLGALLTVGIAVLGWAMVIMLIWNMHYKWLGIETSDRILISFITLFPAAFLIGGSVAIFNPCWSRLGWTLLVGFSAVTGLLLFTIWSDWQRDVLVPITILLGVTTILVGPLMVRSKLPLGVRGPVMFTAVIASIVFTRLTIDVKTPFDMRWESNSNQILMQLDFVLLAFGLTITIGFLNAVMAMRLSKMVWLPWLTVVSVACTVTLLGIGMHTLFVLELGGFLSAGRIASDIREIPVFMRFGIASALVTLALSLALGYMARWGRAIVESSRVQLLALTCPRCGNDCRLGEGDQLCPWCQLQFRLRFEAPECRSCGMTLAPNHPARCPECGTDVVIGLGPDTTGATGAA